MRLLFSYNGIHANTLGIRVIKITRHPLPTISNIYKEQALNGLFFIRQKHTQREIEVEFNLIGATESNLRQLVSNIGSWLNTKKPASLIFDDTNTIEYFAVVESIEVDEELNIGTGTLKFICPDPYSYSTTTTEVSNTGNSTAQTSKAVSIAGNIDVYPIIEVTFTGTSTNFKYTLGSQFINIISGFASGNVLVIDHEKNLVTINGVNKMSSLSLDSQFFELKPGANTVVFEKFSGTAKIKYKNRYL